MHVLQLWRKHCWYIAYSKKQCTSMRGNPHTDALILQPYLPRMTDSPVIFSFRAVKIRGILRALEESCDIITSVTAGQSSWWRRRWGGWPWVVGTGEHRQRGGQVKSGHVQGKETGTSPAIKHVNKQMILILIHSSFKTVALTSALKRVDEELKSNQLAFTTP